jgi:hypothetical protein
LSAEQRQEILDLYTHTDTPVGEIARTYGIKDTYTYNLLNAARIAWRRGDDVPFAAWQARQNGKPLGPPPIPATATEARALAATQQPVPDETLVALERMIEHQPRPILPPKPEPPVRPSLVADASTVVWEVQVSGLIHVTGNEITDAIAAVQGIYPKLRITGIRQA